MTSPPGATVASGHVSGLCEAKQEYTLPMLGNSNCIERFSKPLRAHIEEATKASRPMRKTLRAETPTQAGSAFQFIICRIPDSSWSILGRLMFYQEMALKSELYIACLAYAQYSTYNKKTEKQNKFFRKLREHSIM